MFSRFFILIQNHPKLVLVVIFILTIFLAVPLANFQIDTTLRSTSPDHINVAMDKWYDLQPYDFHHLFVESSEISIFSLPALKEHDVLIKFLENYLKENHWDKEVEIKSFVNLLNNKIKRLSGKDISQVKSQKELNELLAEIVAEAPEEFKKNLQTFFSAEYDREAVDRLVSARQIADLIPFARLFLPDLNFQLPDSKTSHIWFETAERNNIDFKIFSVTLREKSNALDFQHIKVHHSASPLAGHDIDSKIGLNSFILGILIILIIGLIIFLFFKRLPYVLIPLVVMASAIIWTFGAIALLGIKFTILHTIVVPMLVGVGVDGPIHLSARFLEETGEQKNKKAKKQENKKDVEQKNKFFEALKTTYRQTGFSLFLAALTTILAFVSNIFLPGNSSAFRSLGITIILGIFFTLILTYLLWGAILSLMQKRVLVKRYKLKNAAPNFFQGIARQIKKIPQKIFKISIGYPRTIVAVLLIFVLASVFSVPFLKTDTRVTEFVPRGTQSFEDYNFWMNQKVGRHGPQAVLVEGNVLNPKLIFALDKFEKNVQDNKFLGRFENKVKFESVNTLARELGAKITSQIDLKSLYDSWFQNTNIADPFLELTWRDKAEKVIFKDSQGNYSAFAVIIWVDLSNAEKIRQAAFELEEDVQKSGLGEIPGIKISLIGDYFANAKTDMYLRENQFKSFGLAVVLTFLILIPIYARIARFPKRAEWRLTLSRAIALSAVVLTPIVIASLLIVGLMAILQVSLTFLNVMVIAITIGLGIDYAIYLSGRYLEELKASDERGAAEKALESTSTAFWAAAISTIIGFSILSFSFLPIAKSFGFLSALALLFSVIITLFLLPILLVRFVKK